ncbi:hypothetical protein RvY_09068 [Ramazzottius varieornatus]|uniref:Uncharacterized protein n=1 Tax=Ramazzottius varieornatus TaxID=947166 RepID=A0A1D1V811_RAMVA|nr:hypothetical protein RvY_09068 [Ramazzottius varieornatus]
MSQVANCSGLLRASLFPGRNKVGPKPRNAICADPEGKLDIDEIDAAFDEIEKTLKETSRSACKTLGHSFSATSVSTYVDDGQGRPKLFHASAATRTAPGGVRECRRTSCDSESNTETLVVSRHLGDRGYVEEKSRDCITGCEIEQTELVNLNEDGLKDFLHEWRASNRQQYTLKNDESTDKPQSIVCIPYPETENVTEDKKDSDNISEML